jgi:outer membrane lipoprotein-sorting protein
MGSTPQSIAIMDTFDQRTVIEFGELSVNPILDDAIFSFIIPNQVDVINNVR